MFEEAKPFGRLETEHQFTSLRITPLIDIVFLLLIFFMVSTTFTVQPGLQVELPGAGGEVEMAPERDVISISHEGQIYLNGESIRLADLIGQLDGDERIVVVRADRRARHGLIVSVLDSVRKAGVSRVNLSTRPLEEDGNE